MSLEAKIWAWRLGGGGALKKKGLEGDQTPTLEESGRGSDTNLGRVQKGIKHQPWKGIKLGYGP